MRPFRFPSHLYPIIDTLGDPQRSHADLARAVLAAGAPLLQLRLKDCPSRQFVEIARTVKGLADAARARLIINDRPDIAKLIDAAGVHLGQMDLSPHAARQILGPDKTIGYSTHTLAQAEAAARAGIADYISLGPIYPTASKPDADPVVGLEGLRAVRHRADMPVVAVGGITTATLRDTLAAGADAVAMISAIMRAADVEATVRELLLMTP